MSKKTEKEYKVKRKLFFKDGPLRDGMLNILPFSVICEGFTADDYDMLARKFAKRCSYHHVYADAQDAEPWAEALRRYAVADGNYVLVAALYMSSGMNARKMMVVADANADRGKHRKSPVKVVSLFWLNTEPKAKPLTNTTYFFRLNPDYDDFGSY